MYFDPTLAAIKLASKHKINIATFNLISKYQDMQAVTLKTCMYVFNIEMNRVSYLTHSWRSDLILTRGRSVNTRYPRFSDLQFRDVARSENLRERVVTCGTKILGIFMIIPARTSFECLAFVLVSGPRLSRDFHEQNFTNFLALRLALAFSNFKTTCWKSRVDSKVQRI